MNSNYLQHESLSFSIPFHHRCVPGCTREVGRYAQQGYSFVKGIGGRGEGTVSSRIFCITSCIISLINSRYTFAARVLTQAQEEEEVHFLVLVLILFLLEFQVLQVKVPQVL